MGVVRISLTMVVPNTRMGGMAMGAHPGAPACCFCLPAFRLSPFRVFGSLWKPDLLRTGWAVSMLK